MPKTQVIIPAAGSGTRLGCDGPKALVPLNGVPMLIHTLRRFAAAKLLDGLILVASSAHCAAIEGAVRTHFPGASVPVVIGGAERQDSVANGLTALDADTEIVAIHDAARPFIAVDSIRASIAMAALHGAATVAIRCIDTILQADPDAFLQATPERSGLWACQTPQTFQVPLIRDAYIRARAEGFLGTDDATLARRAGAEVKLVEGTAFNFKVTTPSDLVLANLLLREGIV